jgi:hypothetical protein
MFLSETLVRVITADRVREMERANNDRRLMIGDDDDRAHAGAPARSTASVAPLPAHRARTGVRFDVR